jgi:CheY-like chemotaxis protein
MLGFALPRFGLAVWLAAGGEEALRLYREHRKGIDVVLLDVQMAGMDGPQTFAALREWDPAVRVVFMTGNSGPYSVEDLLALGAACVLQKPFPSLAQLAQTLCQVARGEM